MVRFGDGPLTFEWLAPQLRVSPTRPRSAGGLQYDKKSGVIPGAHPRHADIVAQLVRRISIIPTICPSNAGASRSSPRKGTLPPPGNTLIELGHAQRGAAGRKQAG